MPAAFTCALGHQWETGASSETCPVCGGPHLTMAFLPQTGDAADAAARTLAERGAAEPAARSQQDPDRKTLDLPS
jgi:hypothetical protein